MKKLFKVIKFLITRFGQLLKKSRIGIDINGNGKPDVFIDFDSDEERR